MTAPISFDRLASSVLRSKWTVFTELLLVLIPISLVMVPALVLLLLVVVINPIAVPPLTLLAVAGIWGLISLWLYLYSLFRPICPPLWAQFGLAIGGLAVLGSVLIGKGAGLAPLLPSIAIAAHWYWLKSQKIVLSLRTPNASV